MDRGFTVFFLYVHFEPIYFTLIIFLLFVPEMATSFTYYAVHNTCINLAWILYVL